MPVTPSIGLVTSAPDRRVLHDNRWLSGHRHLRGCELYHKKVHSLGEMTYTFFACAARSTHVEVRPTCRRWCHSMHCVPLLSSVVRALCANRAVLRSKVVGRAGRRRGYQMRSYDGRAQPRAVWAMPRPVERAQASDGADDQEKARSAFRSRPCLTQLPLQQAGTVSGRLPTLIPVYI